MPIAVANGQRRIGEQLAVWRRLRRLTAAQVADRAGLSRHTVMRLENGEGASLESVLRIARALGVLDSLVGALDPYATDGWAPALGGSSAGAGAAAQAGARAMSGEVAVFVAVGDDNRLAGRMYSHRHRGVESASFVYDDRFLASPDAYALDPALPLVAGTLQTPIGRALFGAFTDSLPDRWGRMLIRRAERLRANSAATGTRSLSEVDLLLGVRDDLRQGAMRFKLDEQGPFLATEDSGVPALTDLPVLLDIAARVESDSADYDDLRRLLRAGSSLGGARPKAHVLDAAGRVAIAKFPSDGSDAWDVMAWEKVALDLAHDAGVAVPESQLIRVADRHVLIVDRFDRRGTARIGYASAMTMLEARDGDQRSYLEIAAVIEERSASTTPRPAPTLAPDGFLGPDLQHRRPPPQPRVPARGCRDVVAVPRVRPQPQPSAWPEVPQHRHRLRRHSSQRRNPPGRR